MTIAKMTATALLVGVSVYSGVVLAGFGQKLCTTPGYECVKIRHGQNWYNLFPNEKERDIVKKVNRMNTPLHTGMKIAVPKNLSTINAMDVSPFPAQIDSTGQAMVKVDLGKLAWGAYTAEGHLVNWGPVSGGKGYCPDIHRGCRTVTGTFTVHSKGGPGCVSSKFPVGKGGAPMPYCMYFKGGYALHASTMVPGANASHGCVRMFLEDAMWLNHEFVETGATKVKIIP